MTGPHHAGMLNSFLKGFSVSLWKLYHLRWALDHAASHFAFVTPRRIKRMSCARIATHSD